MKNFKRVTEDFVCGNCGNQVKGDGYTDHCPKCLWGKHVDETIPGDRESDCGGLMEPIRAIYTKDKFRIVYKCTKCRHEFEVREGEGDNRDLLVSLVGLV
jgi:DNA-directed RNA polymerase subunit RPC12/RpoP